jgi:hypothetical protein
MARRIFTHRKPISGFLFLVSLLTYSLIPFHSRAQVTPIYLDNNLYDYLFGVGSSWTYEEAFTGTIDSLVETSNMHAFTPEVWIHGELVMGRVEYYKSYYESETLNYQTWDQFIGYVIVREGYDWGNGGQYIFLASYTVGDNTGGAEIVAVYDSLDINNFTFATVTKMLVMQNPFENNSPTFYYFAKGVGMVRKEIMSTDTTNVLEQWNLVNWNLVNSLVVIPEQQKFNKEVELYPNPVGDHAVLKVNDLTLLPLNIVLFNTEGKKVFSKSIDHQSTTLNMGGLPGGLYIAHLSNEKFSLNLKIIRK